ALLHFLGSSLSIAWSALPHHPARCGSVRNIFCSEDRYTYLGFLRQNLEDTEVRVLAYCLMSNHLHLVAVPASEDSISTLIRRVHSRYPSTSMHAPLAQDICGKTDSTVA